VNNEQNAEIKEDKTFEIKDIKLENKTNDLVFRIYDNS
jgi:hypothetical protein